MMMVLRRLLQVLVAMMSIGRTSKKIRSEFIGLSSFLLFWCFMLKGEKIRGGNNFFDAMERLL